MSIPLVSILIPVYNRETLIGVCIESALNQTIKDIEIIVVDNASTDNTWHVCQEYAQRDSRVHIFRNTENIGPVRNWQRCINEAKGIYGKILFSDDLIHRQYLEYAIPMLDHADVGFVFSKVYIGEHEWQGSIQYEYYNANKFIDAEKYLGDCIINGILPVSPGCALFRLKDLQKNLCLTIPSPMINDFDKHGAGPDLLLFLLTAQRYKKVAYLNETLVFFRSHSGSITISDKNRYLQKCYFQAKVWFAIHNRPDLLDELLIQGWLLEVKSQRTIIGYTNFVGQYLWDKNRRLNIFIAIKVLTHLISTKVKKHL